MKVMLLAAGEGVRMRPLTLNTPKPLLPVAGSTLIGLWIRRCVAAGMSELVINTRYLADSIIETLGDGRTFGAHIRYTREVELLETGGGIRNALSLLGNEDFAVISTDVVTDYNLRLLPQVLSDKVAAHLIMVDNPAHHPKGDFALASGRLTEPLGEATLTYSGIGVYSSALFVDCPAGAFQLRRVLEKAIAGDALSGEHHQGYWLDVGTVERYRQLHTDIENQQIDLES